MTFRPLFFLPHRTRVNLFNAAMKRDLLDTPVSTLFWAFDKHGIEFWYRGDTVIWAWPWRRKGLAPFISLGFSGTGEWGDARYWTLKELDEQWECYEKACQPMVDQIQDDIDRRYIEALTAEAKEGNK